MVSIFLLFFLLFDIEEPVIFEIKYPEAKLKIDIDKRVVAILKVKMEVDEYGFVKKFEYLESENIEKEKIEYFFNFFKAQLLGKRIKPMKNNGKAIPCTYIYSFSWILYYPPPEMHYVNNNKSKKIDILKTLRGSIEEREVYEKELIKKATDLLKNYEISQTFLDGITYIFVKNSINIEAIHNEVLNYYDFFIKKYGKFLSNNINLKQTIIFFPNKKIFYDFLEKENLPKWADGLYIGPLRIIFTVSSFEKRYFEVFLHEEAHFLINNFLFENKSISLFLREGLADFFLFLYNENIERWKEYKNILRKEKNKKDILAFLFLWEEKGNKNDKNIKNFYAFSWAFSKFISLKENFSNFIFDLKKNGFTKEIFEKYYGNWKDIEKEFSLFLKKNF